MKRPAELSAAEPKRGRPFRKGASGNPGGQSKEKREFLERLRGEDADVVYDAFLALVKKRNPPAVLRALEYIAGKPPVKVEIPEPLTIASDQVAAAVPIDVGRLGRIAKVLITAGVLELPASD